jgi:hypothetical protein
MAPTTERGVKMSTNPAASEAAAAAAAKEPAPKPVACPSPPTGPPGTIEGSAKMKITVDADELAKDLQGK